MRGKVVGLLTGFFIVGITPAYAGKRMLRCCPADLCWDHPRVCGEKYRMKPNRVCGLGSPPRMRGKDIPVAAIYVEDGITPAYAGKSP